MHTFCQLNIKLKRTEDIKIKLFETCPGLHGTKGPTNSEISYSRYSRILYQIKDYSANSSVTIQIVVLPFTLDNMWKKSTRRFLSTSDECANF